MQGRVDIWKSIHAHPEILLANREYLQKEEQLKMKWYIESRTNFRGLDHEAEKSGLYRVIGELVKIS